MSTFTAEQLTQAIRNATDLGELQRMVGCSDAARRAASERQEELDKIWVHHFRNAQSERDVPAHIRERYKRLTEAQAAHEEKYGSELD